MIDSSMLGSLAQFDRLYVRKSSSSQCNEIIGTIIIDCQRRFGLSSDAFSQRRTFSQTDRIFESSCGKFRKTLSFLFLLLIKNEMFSFLQLIFDPTLDEISSTLNSVGQIRLIETIGHFVRLCDLFSFRPFHREVRRLIFDQVDFHFLFEELRVRHRSKFIKTKITKSNR